MPVASNDHSGVPDDRAGAISESRRQGVRSEAVADPDLDVFVEGLAEAPEIAEARQLAESLGLSARTAEGSRDAPRGTRAVAPDSAARRQRPSHLSDNEIAELWHETTRLQRQFAAAETYRAAVGRYATDSPEEPFRAYAGTPPVAMHPGERYGSQQRPPITGLRAGAWVMLAAAVSLSIIAAAALGAFDPIRGWLHQRLGWTATAATISPVADASPSGSASATDSDQTR